MRLKTAPEIVVHQHLRRAHFLRHRYKLVALAPHHRRYPVLRAPRWFATKPAHPQTYALPTAKPDRENAAALDQSRAKTAKRLAGVQTERPTRGAARAAKSRHK